MKEGLIAVAAKTKPGESPMVGHGGKVAALFLIKWLRGGFEFLKNESGDLSRNFWIGQPLVIESELGFPNQAQAIGSCENKAMTCLLFQAGRPKVMG